MCLIKLINTHCRGYQYIPDPECPRGECGRSVRKEGACSDDECACDDCPFGMRVVEVEGEKECGRCRRCKALRMTDEEEGALRGVARRVLRSGWTRTKPSKGTLMEWVG
jgi:hypothetical protein